MPLPVAPVSPLGPCGPAAPVAPVSPRGPCAPVAPVSPLAPVAPVAPAVPVSPFGPCEPVAPVAPLGPCAPVAPVAPASPFGPAAPLSPFGPCLTLSTEAGYLASLLSGRSFPAAGLADAWNPSTRSLLVTIVPAANAPPQSASSKAVEATTSAGDGRKNLSKPRMESSSAGAAPRRKSGRVRR